MKPMIFLTAALAMASNMAFAAVTVDSIAADLKAQGYTRIEIQQRATGFKAEAYRGGEKFEAVYDATTGDVLTTSTRANGSDDSDDDKGKSSSDSDHHSGDHDSDDHDSGDHDSDDHDSDDHDSDDHDSGDHDGGDNGHDDD